MKLPLPEWAKRPMFKTAPAPVVLTEPAERGVNAARKRDRHKPGYMAAYMRAYRAKG